MHFTGCTDISVKTFVVLPIICLNIGTPKRINFPFVPMEKLLIVGDPKFRHITVSHVLVPGQRQNIQNVAVKNSH